MSQIEFPEITEALLKRSLVTRRLIPFLMRIGNNSGENLGNGNNWDSLLIPAGKEVSIAFKTPSKGFVRFLRMHANVWTKEGGRFFQWENREPDQQKKRASYHKYISVTLSIASSARVLIGENLRQANTANALDGNLSNLVGNFFPSHLRVPYLLGSNDMITIKLKNNHNVDLYIGGCLFAYRINS